MGGGLVSIFRTLFGKPRRGTVGVMGKMLFLLTAALGAVPLAAGEALPRESPEAWPQFHRETRPWSYWWWMGSAVDRTNLVRELGRYRAAGWGGVHIIPIYGAKGWESRCIPFLSEEWMAMLRYTLSEAERLGLGVDMTTGTGWCFGGPNVTEREANARVVIRKIEKGSLAGLRPPAGVESPALICVSPSGGWTNVTALLGKGAEAVRRAPPDAQFYLVGQRFSGRRVKRAAPGGEGPMLNPIYPQAMRRYLERFTKAFAGWSGSGLRAMYHDSYEYVSDWAPDFLDQFARRRGYRLEPHLPALLGEGTKEETARVRADCRRTVSDIMVEETFPIWVRWAHERGFQTRFEAHGAPANLLDLYALADIPETEMFRNDRDPLVAKFASSAAHLTGRRLVSAETGTWLKEHFTVTLADLKALADDLFLSGVNHIIFHGTCYSPDEAGWPGWVFYASTQLNPRNPIWHDVPALAAYITRCQSILQSGEPDNELLVYWPIHDLWREGDGLVRQLTVHNAAQWFRAQPVGRAAERLWEGGWSFDYVSDRQLLACRTEGGRIRAPGAACRALLIPPCRRMPLRTLKAALDLAKTGATVIFAGALPEDVPGLAELESRRAALNRLLGGIRWEPAGRVQSARFGRGRLWLGDPEPALRAAGLRAEPMVARTGLRFIRRRFHAGRHYFIANRGREAFRGWIPLRGPAASALWMDPMSGETGRALLRSGSAAEPRVWARLRPGEALILRVFEKRLVRGPLWTWAEATGEPIPLRGEWHVRFLSGGPTLPAPFKAGKPGSWTELGGPEAARFAGTARYALKFDAPCRDPAATWLLDLGRVAESARVRLNGKDLGTLIAPPFRLFLGRLKPRGNLLEVDVTNLAANRVRDLDRRKVPWKNFHDINFVNIDYKAFDASGWPLRDSGLLGPVRLFPARRLSGPDSESR